MVQGERCGGGLLETLFPGLADWLRDPFDERLRARLLAARVPQPSAVVPLTPLLRGRDIWQLAIRALIRYLDRSNVIASELWHYSFNHNNEVLTRGMMTEGKCDCPYSIRRTALPFHRIIFMEPAITDPVNDQPGRVRLSVYRDSTLTVAVVLTMGDIPPRCPPSPPALNTREISDRSSGVVFWEAEFRNVNGTQVVKEEDKISADDLNTVAESLKARADEFFQKGEADLIAQLRTACLRES